MFDEELDQLGGGRRNTFSEWSVVTTTVELTTENCSQ